MPDHVETRLQPGLSCFWKPLVMGRVKWVAVMRLSKALFQFFNNEMAALIRIISIDQ